MAMLPYSGEFSPGAWNALFENIDESHLVSHSATASVAWGAPWCLDAGGETEKTNTKDVIPNSPAAENLPSLLEAKMRLSAWETDDAKHDGTLINTIQDSVSSDSSISGMCRKALRYLFKPTL